MTRKLNFDLRRDPQSGYSGGIVLRDELGDVSFVRGNHVTVKDRHYVLVSYRDFQLICDRDDFPGLTKESPINEWYVATMKVLISKLGPYEFIGLVDVLYANGKQAGVAEAREEIRRVLLGQP
jgi:hypothetical protein